MGLMAPVDGDQVNIGVLALRQALRVFDGV
jgi:hypothetical protein